MRSKSTELMDEIYSYIDQYYSSKHTSPSTAEIANGVGVSKATDYRYLVEMDNRGMLEYDLRGVATTPLRYMHLRASGV